MQRLLFADRQCGHSDADAVVRGNLTVNSSQPKGTADSAVPFLLLLDCKKRYKSCEPAEDPLASTHIFLDGVCRQYLCKINV